MQMPDSCYARALSGKVKRKRAAYEWHIGNAAYFWMQNINDAEVILLTTAPYSFKALKYSTLLVFSGSFSLVCIWVRLLNPIPQQQCS